MIWILGIPIATGLIFAAFLILFLGKRIDCEDDNSAINIQRKKLFGVLSLISGIVFAAVIIWYVIQFMYYM
ncbi:MAG: hypothetical protein Q4A48_04925 [Bacillota bacterium]|nr:hypothetical protein [Bacillota bacterium]